MMPKDKEPNTYKNFARLTPLVEGWGGRVLKGLGLGRLSLLRGPGHS